MKEINKGDLCTVRFMQDGRLVIETGIVVLELKRLTPFEETRYNVYVFRVKKNMKFPLRHIHMLEKT